MKMYHVFAYIQLYILDNKIIIAKLVNKMERKLNEIFTKQIKSILYMKIGVNYRNEDKKVVKSKKMLTINSR